MEKNPPGDVYVAITLGNLTVAWNVEGVSWNPDIAFDIKNRAMDMVAEALDLAVSHGLLTSDDTDEYVAIVDEDENLG